MVKFFLPIVCVILQFVWLPCTSQSKLRSDTIQARTYFNRGLHYDSKGNYDSAVYFLKKASTIYKKYKLIRLNIDVQNKWAFDLCMKGDLQNASMLLEDNLEQCTRSMKPASMPFADTYHGLGVAYYGAGYYREAIDFFKKSLVIKRSLLGNIHQKVASSINNLGILYETLELLDTAKVYYQEYLSLSLQLHGMKSRDVANAYNNLGGNAYYNTNYKVAIEYYQKSLDIYKVVLEENHPELASSYINLGVVFIEIGEYQKALDYIFYAARIIRDNYGEESPQYLNVLLNAGTTYAHMGDLKKALENSLKGYSTAEKIFGSDYPQLSKLALNIGTIYHDMADYTKSIEWQERSLAMNIKLQGDSSFEVASNYNNISNSYFLMQKYAEAEKYILKSINIKRKTFGTHHQSLAFSYGNLGNIYFAQKKFKQSLEADQKGLIANHFSFSDTTVSSIPPLSGFSAINTFVELLIQKASCFLQLYFENNNPQTLQIGLKHLLAADSLLIQSQFEMESDEDLILLSSDLKKISVVGLSICDQLYRINKDRQYLDQMFYFKERSRGTALRLAIAHAQAGKHSGLSAEMRDKQTSLQKSLSENKLALVKLIESGAKEGDHSVSSLRTTIFEINEKYENFVVNVQQKNPKYYALRYKVSPATSEQIQQRYLKRFPRTALVQYSLFDSTLNILVLTHNHISVYDTTVLLNIEKTVRALRNSVVYQSNNQLFNFSRQLYDALWAPVEEIFKKTNSNIEHVVVIPDAILAYLPFEALIMPGGKYKDFRKTPFLLTKYAISYSTSATHWLENVEAPAKYGDRDFVAFAPIFSDESKTNFLVNTTERSSLKKDTATRSFLHDGKIEAIPHSRDEVMSIEQLYKKRNLFAKYFIFRDAKEAAIKDPELSHYRYIHLATHGFVNDDFPELSALILAQDSTNGEDGVLYSGEIYNLEWNADLVTLSACETGLGKIAQGEGIIGLTRGFMYAGARNLLVSLWRVSDASTSQLMIAFYNDLLTSGQKAEALQTAKLSLVKTKSFNHPYYWAPFILIGN